ncbi:MAG: hypothetical protein ACTHK1_09310 [Actinomycetales bacterium]
MTMTGPLVRDEVWAQLPQRRLPRSRVVGGLAGLLALGLAVLALVQLGVVVPRISVQSNGWDAPAGSSRVTAYLTITNDGVRPVRLRDVHVPASWVRVKSIAATPAGDWKAAIAPGHQLQLNVAMTVTNCQAIPRDGASLRLDVSGPVLDSTLSLQPNGDQDPKAPGSYSYSGEDPWELGWLTLPAQRACGLVDMP